MILPNMFVILTLCFNPFNHWALLRHAFHWLRASHWPCKLGPLIGLASSGLSLALQARAYHWPGKLGPLTGFVKPDRRFWNTGGPGSDARVGLE